MEIGEHCTLATCNRLTFLPLNCKNCQGRYCEDHFKPDAHSCTASDKTPDVTVITCPVCNKIVPIPRELDASGKTKIMDPNRIISDHIERGCPDAGKSTLPPQKVNKCAFCPQKEATLIKCRSCQKSFCVKHRHESDHKCGAATKSNSNSPRQSPAIQKRTIPPQSQPNTANDEALARALQQSLYEEEGSRNTGNQRSNGATSNPNNCHVQ